MCNRLVARTIEAIGFFRTNLDKDKFRPATIHYLLFSLISKKLILLLFASCNLGKNGKE